VSRVKLAYVVAQLAIEEILRVIAARPDQREIREVGKDMAPGGGATFLGRTAEVLHTIALQDGALILDKGFPRFVHGIITI
jgi:hypothetical protein